MCHWLSHTSNTTYLDVGGISLAIFCWELFKENWEKLFQLDCIVVGLVLLANGLDPNPIEINQFNWIYS